MAFALTAAERGQRITLYDAVDELGGQWNMAKVVPGKSGAARPRRSRRPLGKPVDADEIVAEGYDEIVFTTGVTPRTPDILGIDHPKVVSYVDVLSGRVDPDERVAILGAGGIGFDTAEFLVGDPALTCNRSSSCTTGPCLKPELDSAVTLPRHRSRSRPHAR